MNNKQVKRENWGKWTEFFFSVLGSMVGLANIWRFPYLCYKNGGGAFLIPFFFFLFIAAVPLLFVELSYSQYSNLGPGKVWILCPLFKGIGYGMVILSSIISIFYTVILSWALYYLYISMHPVLAWRYCSNSWNTWQCYETVPNTNRTFPFQNDNSTYLQQSLGLNNSNSTFHRRAISASEQFWKHHVLEITSGAGNMGSIRYPLLLCLAISWIFVFICLIKGIKSSGKVVYVAATLPYLLLTILLGRAVTLPGSKDGLLYYMLPKWEKLKEFSVWKDGAVQIFYSAGVGVGGISTLASYNNFNNNCQRDAFIFPLIDGLTSWFAGLTTFCILGYMAHISNTDISKVVTQGPGVAFIVYPEALSTLPFAQLWSSLFFLMLFMVGMDSQFVHVQTLVTALTDIFPNQLRKRKMLITAIICIITFLLGIPCVTQGGVYIVQILDWYCASLSLLFLAFMEACGVCYLYGVSRLFDDITLMIGYKPLAIWKPFCKYVAPVSAFACWIITLIGHSSLKYDSGEPFPIWVSYFGGVIALLSLIPFPVAAITELLSLPGPFLKRLKTSVMPTSEWGPAIKKYQQCKNDINMLTIEET